jgi:hypothetical protein
MRAALALAVLLSSAPAWAQRFLPDDPLARDADDAPVAKPGAVELSTAYDVIEHTFHHRPGKRALPSANANTLGEVPDSSWFENRIGVRDLSIAELVRGPATSDGPAGAWTVISGKSEGITPGFTVRDEEGEVWFVKFDRAAYPVLSTGAEVITTRFFHAIGYHVPETHVAYFRREELTIDPRARVAVKGGPKQKLTSERLDHILRDVKREADGTLRAVVSRRLPGEPLGPHKYHGTRTDDANDVFPHEDRRELRGLRVFCAWLNHDDSRSVNSLDMFVPPGYVKHHLLDFSSALGSGSDASRRIGPQNARAGNEYVIDFGAMARAAFTLGIADRPWRHVKYPDVPEVGNLEADFFDPERWKPEYPNPAFERMQPEDAFWAARIVARFSDEAIAAIVKTGRLGNPDAEAYLAEVLRKRRDKVVARYYRVVSPLDAFRADGGAVAFADLGPRGGLPPASAFEVEWAAFDNATGARRALGAPGRAAAASLPIPPADDAFLVARVRAVRGEGARDPYVDVFLRNGPAPSVVGLEREPKP